MLLFSEVHDSHSAFQGLSDSLVTGTAVTRMINLHHNKFSGTGKHNSYYYLVVLTST